MLIKNIFSRLKRNDLLKDSFWSLMGNALGKGLSLVGAIAVARFLGSEEFGEYGLIKGTLLSIAIFSSFGLGYTATKFIAECKHENYVRIRQIIKTNRVITLFSSGTIAIIVAIFSVPIADWLDNPNLSAILRYTSIAIIFNAIITTQIGELSGLRAYKTIARNNVISGVLNFFLSVFGAYFWGLIGAIISLICSLIFNICLNSYSLNKYLPKQNEQIILSKALYVEILKFSLPIALQESLYSITSWLSMALLIKLSTYSQLGLFSAASQWNAVMLFIPGALRNVALSHLSENSNNLSTSIKISNRLLLVNFTCTFIPALIIALCSKWIATFYGDSFSELPSILNISVFTAVITSMTNILAQELIAQNYNWYLFWTRFLRDSLSLCLAYIIVKNFGNGAENFAMATLIACFTYLCVLFIKRHIIYTKKQIIQ